MDPAFPDSFQEYVDALMNISKSTGATMAQAMKMKCAGWKVQAKWQFKGLFEGNTSFPILFVANMVDNVAPLRSASANAAGFNGSVALIQDSYGHTILSTPSKCTAAAIKAYFDNGTLPQEGTHCEPDITPFGHSEVNDMDVDSLDYSLWRLSLAPEKLVSLGH